MGNVYPIFIGESGAAPSPVIPTWFPEDNARFAWVVRADEPSSPLPMQGDDSGNGLIMMSTEGASPTFNSVGVGGLPSAHFLGGPVQSFFGEFAKDWSFCHQPPFSFACYINVADGLNSQIIWRTKTAAATAGALLSWDGGNHRFVFIMYDAAGGALVSLAPANGTSLAGDHLIVVRITSPNATLGPRASVPVAELWVDNVRLATAAFGAGAISGLAPLAPLTWGSGFAGANALTGGRVRWGTFHSRRYMDSEVQYFWDARDTIASQRELVIPWLMGDSITFNAAAYRRWLDVRTRRTKNLFKLATGTQSLVTNFPGYDPINDGIVGQTIPQMIARMGAALPRDPTVNLFLGGTNQLGAGPPLQPIVDDYIEALQTMFARFPVPTYGLTIPRGNGTVVGYNTTVDSFNALLRVQVPAAGFQLIDFYNPPGTTNYPYDNATWANDGVGHPSPIGGVGEGNNVAHTLGWGSD